MRPILILLAILLVVGCGSSSPTGPDYIAPGNVSGHWIAEDPEELDPWGETVVLLELFLEQDGSKVSGSFLAVLEDGRILADSTSGTYDAERGIMELFIAPPIFANGSLPRFDHYFRFTSEREMRLVVDPEKTGLFRSLKFNKVADYP